MDFESPPADVGGLALRCAPAARLRGDSLIGTAGPASGFLLVERLGRWGPHAPLDSAFDRAVAHRLVERCEALGIRVLLIRRPDRSASGLARWFLADVRQASPGIRSGEFSHDRELLHLPLEPRDRAGDAHRQPLYLVCTHAQHDACCAVDGRPVAAALFAARPEQTWECSHLGGDRFAANVLVLPHGFTYGGVEPATALDLVEAYEENRVVPRLLRGRCGLSPAAQAAQHLAREHFGYLDVEALAVHATYQVGDGWRVELSDRDAVVAVTVRIATDAEPARLTCGAARLAVPRRFELVAISRQ